VAFSRNGQFLASLKPDSVKVWNLLKANERVALAGHDSGVPSLAFSATDNILASSGKDQRVRIWDLAARRALRTIELDGPVQCLAFSPNGKWLATGDGSVGETVPKTLNVWSMTDARFRKVIAHDLGTGGDQSVTSAAFSPDGKYFAACANGMTLWSVTETSGAAEDIEFTKITHIDGEASLFVTFSPDSQLVMWTDKWDRVRGLDIRANRQIDLPAIMNQGWHGLAFVNDGLAFVGADGALKVWDPRANKLLHSLAEPGEFQSPHIAATPDRAYLAAVQTPETVALWDMRQNQKLFHFRPERSEVWSLAFSPKGTMLAVGLSDGGVAVWDLKRINGALKNLELAWRSDWDDDQPRPN
jgi:WD40 repeat protein